LFRSFQWQVQRLFKRSNLNLLEIDGFFNGNFGGKIWIMSPYFNGSHKLRKYKIFQKYVKNLKTVKAIIASYSKLHPRAHHATIKIENRSIIEPNSILKIQLKINHCAVFPFDRKVQRQLFLNLN
jgi:hypothetical protein